MTLKNEQKRNCRVAKSTKMEMKCYRIRFCDGQKELKSGQERWKETENVKKKSKYSVKLARGNILNIHKTN